MREIFLLGSDNYFQQNISIIAKNLSNESVNESKDIQKEIEKFNFSWLTTTKESYFSYHTIPFDNFSSSSPMSVFFDLKRKCFHNTALLLVIFWQGCNIFASVLPRENLSAGFFAQVIAYKLWSHRTNAALIKENEFASSEDRKNHSLLFYWKFRLIRNFIFYFSLRFLTRSESKMTK